ncbi:MAG: histidinol dehydrogenase, partial [Cruoricaptor ignavus]|nr:histidinol dehydrogenase [Cruoricaptor ignavus]
MNTYKNPEKNTWAELCKRPTIEKNNLKDIINQVFTEVQTKGDEALLDYTERFDGVRLSQLQVSENECEEAEKQITENLKNAIKTAKNNIEKFHRSQIEEPKKIETTKGVVCWREARPISNMGIYIPGGTAPLFSTVLMLAIPAQIAGCKEVVLCTPPDENGKINPAILYAAKLCGVTK